MVSETPNGNSDWRVGLSVKPKFRSHPLYYESGKVLQVYESGYAGVWDGDGVLKVEMLSGKTMLVPASDWVTA